MKTARQLADEINASPRDLVSSALRDRRITYGLPLTAVAQQVGISKAALSNLELAGANASVITALRLARFYETTVEDLFGPLADDEVRS